MITDNQKILVDLLKQATSSVTVDDNVTVIEHFISALEQEIIERIEGNNLGNVSYSTGEHLTGANWIDGKPIYRKTVVFGALPNTSTKNVPHNITGLDIVVSLEGVAKHFSIGNYLPLSYPTGIARVELLIQGPSVRIVTDDNFQDWTETYVIIEYTKTD